MQWFLCSEESPKISSPLVADPELVAGKGED
jgi:hypothetical protein